MVAALVAAAGASGCGGEQETSVKATAPGDTVTTVGDGSFGGIWPYTSPEQADGVVDGTYMDPVATAKAFAAEYAGMSAPVTGEFRPGDNNSGEVEVRPKPDSPFVTTVLLRRVAGEGTPWMVIGAAAERVVVETPKALAALASPVAVAGRSSAFEGTVLVQVKEDGMGPGEFLGQEPLIGGAAEELEPFSGVVEFRAPTRGAGALVILTESAEDGTVEQLSAVKVTFLKRR